MWFFELKFSDSKIVIYFLVIYQNMQFDDILLSNSKENLIVQKTITLLLIPKFS